MPNDILLLSLMLPHLFKTKEMSCFIGPCATLILLKVIGSLESQYLFSWPLVELFHFD